MRDALGRGVRAVRGPEGVVDVEIAELGQTPREGGIVALLFGMEAHVLEQQHVAVAQLRNGVVGFLADAVVGERDRTPRRSASACATGRSEKRGSGLPSGRPRCDSTIVRAPRSCSQRSVGTAASIARVVDDRAVRHRHVEILAHQDALAADVEICKSSKRHGERPAAADSRGHLRQHHLR